MEGGTEAEEAMEEAVVVGGGLELPPSFSLSLSLSLCLSFFVSFLFFFFLSYVLNI